MTRPPPAGWAAGVPELVGPALFASHVRDVPDFPEPGVTFKDVTPLLNDHAAFSAAVDAIASFAGEHTIDVVVGMESRGFILGAPVALQLSAGFVPARKAGKLPGPVLSEAFALEYGEEVLQLHRDAIRPGQRVLVVDDVLATGGTAAATARLVEGLGGSVVAFGFLIELGFLDGRSLLTGHEVHSLLTY